MERTILHCDMNNFYASVECLYRPELRGKAVAVGGDAERRQGIVLAKNNLAKRYGVQTGEALWQAKKKCPGLVFVPPDFEKYLRFSRMAGEIYGDYTDKVEPFGLDECWLDVTGSEADGKGAADRIRARIRRELGITASVGVSFNKVFAKLGSDMRKPDATTVIARTDFKQKAWPLPVDDLLCVGPATADKLRRRCIRTIGDLARADRHFLRLLLGRPGEILWAFANGLDTSPVADRSASFPIKSVGNSTTAPRDLIGDGDVRITLHALCDSVAARLRACGLVCRTVQISVRDSRLESYTRQCRLEAPASAAGILFRAAYSLYKRHHPTGRPIRSLGVRGCDLLPEENLQLSFFPEGRRMQRLDALERAVDEVRRRFGYAALRRGIMLTDPALSAVNPKEDHVIHPVGFFR